MLLSLCSSRCIGFLMTPHFTSIYECERPVIQGLSENEIFICTRLLVSTPILLEVIQVILPYCEPDGSGLYPLNYLCGFHILVSFLTAGYSPSVAL